jgi:hypothetical protein
MTACGQQSQRSVVHLERLRVRRRDSFLLNMKLLTVICYVFTQASIPWPRPTPTIIFLRSSFLME